MFNWLRNTFGSCKDRWYHEWQRKPGEPKLGDTRICTVCSLKQEVVGWYSAMDLDPMAQWKDVS